MEPVRAWTSPPAKLLVPEVPGPCWDLMQCPTAQPPAAERGMMSISSLQGRACHRDAVGEEEPNCVPENIHVLWP